MKTLTALLITLIAFGSFHVAVAQELSIEPPSALVDEPVTITLSGLEPDSEVTLRARTVDDTGLSWESWATFEAAYDGSVNLAEAPLEGSYEGAEPMGLFWSMKPDGEPEAGFFLHTSLEPLHVTFTAEVDGETVATAEAERLAVAPDVTRTEVRDEGIIGTFFTPPGEGPHPAMIVLGGSEGGLDEGTAALFASRGYAALALAYFGVEDLPQELVEVPLETFYEALEWLAGQDAVDAGRIALFGASKGAEAALLVASRRPEVRAVVAYVPSDVVWQGISFNPAATPRSSWREDGEGLPFVPYVFTEEAFMGMQPGDATVLEPMYRGSLEAYDDDAALIPVERIQGPVLLVSSGDDKLWPGALMAERAHVRLEDHDYEVKHLTFAEAGHVILLPNLPAWGTTEFEGMAMGGSAEANARAAIESWARVLEFLGDSLR